MFFGSFHPHTDKVLMRCFPVNRFEQPDKMKFRKTSFISNVGKIDVLSVVSINKKLGLHDALVEIDPRIFYRFFHSKNLISIPSNLLFLLNQDNQSSSLLIIYETDGNRLFRAGCTQLFLTFADFFTDKWPNTPNTNSLI